MSTTTNQSKTHQHQKKLSGTTESREVVVRTIGGYELCSQKLGKGSFARVELAIHALTNTKVALKIIDLGRVDDKYTRKNIVREATILKHLHHDYIIRLYETLAYHDSYCFVTEYLGGGDLLAYVKEQKERKLGEKPARKIFMQLVEAVQYLHSKGIVHRDLKMQNIMLTDDKRKIKLIDFGLSNFFDRTNSLTTQCGSIEYAAPELFDKGAGYGPSIEIWSMGVILYAITIGRMPFVARPGDKKENLVVQVRRGLNMSHESSLKSVSSDLKCLLIKLLDPDRERRIPIEGLYTNNWVTEKGTKPFIPNPPKHVTYETRHKVTEQVATLYRKSIDATTKHLQVNQFDAIDATFQILLDQTLASQTSNSHRTITSAPAISFARPLNFFKRRPHTARPDRPQSARPERRLIEQNRPHKEKFLVKNAANVGDKIPTESKQQSSSPDALYEESGVASSLQSRCGEDDLKQVPLHTRIMNHHLTNNNSKYKHRRVTNRYPCVTKSIEGEFVLNSAQSAKGRRNVECNGIRFTYSDVNSERFRVTETQKLDGKVSHSKSPKKSKSVCARCSSPYEARQMLHRNSFPLKTTLVNPSSSQDVITCHNELSMGGSRKKKSKVDTLKFASSNRPAMNESLAASVQVNIAGSSSINSTKRNPSTTTTTSPPLFIDLSQLSIDKGNSILQKKSSSHYKPKRKVSFKE